MPEDCIPSYTQEQSHTCCMPEDCVPSYTQEQSHTCCMPEDCIPSYTHTTNSHTCSMPEDCVPCETLTTVPHMLYASRLYPLKLRQQSHVCSMPQDCTFTLCNSNNSPTHALCLKTARLPCATQTTVPHMLYASRLYPLKLRQQSHIYALCLKTAHYPVQLKQQSHTCSMPQDYPLKLRHSNMQSHIRSVSQDCMFTPWNSNNSPTHALCLKTCVPSETQTHALLWLVNISLTHALYSWRPRTLTLWKSLPLFKKEAADKLPKWKSTTKNVT